MATVCAVSASLYRARVLKRYLQCNALGVRQNFWRWRLYVLFLFQTDKNVSCIIIWSTSYYVQQKKKRQRENLFIHETGVQHHWIHINLDQIHHPTSTAADWQEQKTLSNVWCCQCRHIFSSSPSFFSSSVERNVCSFIRQFTINGNIPKSPTKMYW